MCHSAMRGIYNIRKREPGTPESEHAAITFRHTIRMNPDKALVRWMGGRGLAEAGWWCPGWDIAG